MYYDVARFAIREAVYGAAGKLEVSVPVEALEAVLDKLAYLDGRKYEPSAKALNEYLEFKRKTGTAEPGNIR